MKRHLVRILTFMVTFVTLLGCTFITGTASATPPAVPYPQGTDFPLMMYQVTSATYATNVAQYGWNVLQNYGNSTNSLINSYCQMAAGLGVSVDVKIPCTGSPGSYTEWTQSQVQTWIQGSMTNNNIAWWDMPEECTPWSASDLKMLNDYRSWERLYDTTGPRPTYEVNYRASETTIVTNTDILSLEDYGPGGYGSTNGTALFSPSHASVRYAVQQVGLASIRNAGATCGSNYLAGQKTLVIGLYDAAPNAGMPVPTTNQCYHDFWSAVASGAQGIYLYSYYHAVHDSPQPALSNNLAPYNLAASQISGSELGQVVLFGTQNTNVSFTVTSGPTNTETFLGSSTTNYWSYPSLNILCKTWSTNVYLIAVNSTSNSVTANITNLPVAAATATVMFESRSVTVSGSGFSDSFQPWGVHIYSMPSSSAPLPPPAPTALSATGGNTVVNLAWTQSTGTGITGNNVYRSTTGSGGPYNLLATLAATTSYSDTAVVNGTTYFYSVSAVNGNGESALSAYAGATPQATPPAAPTGLAATAGNNQVALTWTASTGATSYNVKRATVSGGPYTTLASPTGTSYTDTTAVNGTTYYYVVSAVNTGGESANSSQVSATPQLPAPAAPTGLTATPGNNQVALSWTASTGATSYNVKRATVNGGPYTTIASPTGTSYTDATAVNGTTYYYVVSAVNTAGESANSTQVSATPQPPAPAAPTGLSATTVSSSQINLSWTASSGATSYNVKRATVSGGPYTTIASGVATTTYSDTSAAGGTTYYYVVSAVNGGGESANSTEASATTIPAAPAGLTATAGNSQVALSWGASTGATSYNVKRATVSGGPYTTIGTSTAGSYTDASAVNGTAYYYVVSAVNASGESVNSTEVSATPSAPVTPNAPTSLTASSSFKRKITLNWTQSTSANISSNSVYRATVDGGPYTKVTTMATNTTYTDTGLTSGTTYYYVVTAINSSGQESTNSNQAFATAR